MLVGERSTGLASIVDVVGRASGPLSTAFVLLAMGEMLPGLHGLLPAGLSGWLQAGKETEKPEKKS